MKEASPRNPLGMAEVHPLLTNERVQRLPSKPSTLQGTRARSSYPGPRRRMSERTLKDSTAQILAAADIPHRTRPPFQRSTSALSCLSPPKSLLRPTTQYEQTRRKPAGRYSTSRGSRRSKSVPLFPTNDSSMFGSATEALQTKHFPAIGSGLVRFPELGRRRKSKAATSPQSQSQSPTKAGSGFLQCTLPKPLQPRYFSQTVYSPKERGPCLRCIARGNMPRNTQVIRVGGGYIILGQEWGRFIPDKQARQLQRNSRKHSELDHATDAEMEEKFGSTIRRRLDDGTLLLDDGSMVDPKTGIRTLADGTQIFQDGSRILSDGTRVPASNDANIMFGQRSDSLYDDPFIDGDQSGPVLRRGTRTRLGDSGQTEEAARKEAAKQEAMKKANKLWNFDDEIKEVLEDGTIILEDGTRVNPDGTMTLADGTTLDKDASRKLAMKRKGRKLVKKKPPGPLPDRKENESEQEYRVRMKSMGYTDTDLKKTALRSDSTLSIASMDSNGNPKQNGRRGGRKLRLGSLDQANAAHVRKAKEAKMRMLGKASVALDYLSKYCILSENQLIQYRSVFDHIDTDQDDLITYTELEFGLKTVNKEIITNKEVAYVGAVLEISKNTPINFRFFAVIAALSERVVGLDEIVRKLVNQIDARALALKLKKCTELFYLLDEKKEGMVEMEALMHEIRAGRITQEHEDIILDKFGEDNKFFVDFLDFLTYLPLFMEIHGTITDNPLNDEREH